MNTSLKYLEEPKLEFGNNQLAQDPRDGLLLFGPYEKLTNYSVQAGVIGASRGLQLYSSFVERLSKPILSKKTLYGRVLDDEVQRPSFPGFEAVFGIGWDKNPSFSITLRDIEIKKILAEKNKKIRTRRFVDLYLQEIIRTIQEEDVNLNIWFLVIPRKVYLACRPNSAGRGLGKGTLDFITKSKEGQLSLLDGDDNYINTITEIAESTSDFHNLIKAELIHNNVSIPVQIIVDSTLEFREKLQRKKYEDSMIAHIAWTQSTSLYYKLGRLPWRLNSLRDGVCYIGLVFKQMPNREENVCSAAQMFLKDGDGAVFRGNIGLWKAKNRFEYHLDAQAAEKLIGLGLDDYHRKWKKYPVEIFVHSRSKFDEEEWNGFIAAIEKRNAKTTLVGVVIKDTRESKRSILKLYKDNKQSPGNYGNLRGLAYPTSENSGYLFTRGFIPRLGTSNTVEISNPLYIEITNGTCDLDTVMEDVLALTKLNYNSCVFGDGLPVTLRFSDRIGGILTATERWESSIRQFRYYI